MKHSMTQNRSAGFTLFEMIVVIMIFVLMAGGIYATVSAAVQALPDDRLTSRSADQPPISTATWIWPLI